MPEQVLNIDITGAVARLTMNRPRQRNAMSDDLLFALDDFFRAPPKAVKAVILTGTAGHFCSGLDLSEHVERDSQQAMAHSRTWHRVMDTIQFGGLPVVAAMFGAVIGGGLELATACHVRVAEPSAVFQLPEARRGIFVGGGGSVRIGRILGPDRMVEMMLTGRKLNAQEGYELGLAHYQCAAGDALAKAQSLAQQIAENASLSNLMVLQALPRIGDMSRSDGLFTESLCTALTQTGEDAREGLAAFLEKRPPKFK